MVHKVPKTILLSLVVAGGLTSPAALLAASAEEDLNSGDPARVQNARDAFSRRYEAAQNLSGSADDKADGIVYSRWKIACCDYRLGRREAAESALEDLARAYPAHGLMLLVQRELGTFYFNDWKIAAAQDHLRRALELAPDYRFAQKSYALTPLQLLHIKVMYASTFVHLGDNKTGEEKMAALEQEARHALAALRQQPAHGVEEQEYQCLLADIGMHRAELDKRNRKTPAAIMRRKACLECLQPITSAESLRKQAECHKFLADDYSKLTRFADAAAELNAAEVIERSHFDNKSYGKLRHMRAQLQVEQALYDFENDPDDPALPQRLAKAEQFAAEAIAYQQKASREPAIDTANAWNDLALTSDLRGRIFEAAQRGPEALRAFQAAKDWADRSIGLFAKFLGPEHDIVLELRCNRARMSFKLGDTAAARREVEEVLQKLTGRYGPDHAECAPCQELLVELETCCGNFAAAAAHAQAGRRLAAKVFPSIATGLTAVEQQTFCRRWDDPLLHAALRLGAIRPTLAETSAAWLLNGKAKSSEWLADSYRQPRGRAKLDDFRRSVQRAAYFLYGDPGKDPAAELLREKKRQRDLAEQQAVPRAQSPAEWHELNALRERLTPAEVYVDCFCLNEASGAKRAYYAWVVTRSDPVQVVKLGAAGPIDKRVAALSARLEAIGKTGFSSAGVGEDEEDLRRNYLQPLSEMIFVPLLDKTQGKSRWIISPDGSLWNIPWAAMLLPGRGEYAVTRLTFRHVISGRDLLKPDAPAGNGQALILADPAYDFRPPHVAGSWRPRGSYFYAESLPASAAEGRAVAQCLAAHGGSADLQTRENADKKAVLALQSSPRTLYLSTHGFFLPLRTARAADPFLCCGVALAGFNFVPAASQESLQLPGLLTAAEVLTANLQGTDLVVLSACQTGAGVTSYGQGAASLRQAFHLAGAKAVVSTLWSVSDRHSKELMVDFMNELSLAPRRDKAEALRRAQVKMIDAYHTHPFFWAAFTLSGF